VNYGPDIYVGYWVMRRRYERIFVPYFKQNPDKPVQGYWAQWSTEWRFWDEEWPDGVVEGEAARMDAGIAEAAASSGRTNRQRSMV
jgi:hypothetical protein